jgi:hypothetical protein
MLFDPHIFHTIPGFLSWHISQVVEKNVVISLSASQGGAILVTIGIRGFYTDTRGAKT